MLFEHYVSCHIYNIQVITYTSAMCYDLSDLFYVLVFKIFVLLAILYVFVFFS